jgi:iron(III) transport system substrate-binding protein
MELLLTGGRISAEEAHQLGLVTCVSPPGGALAAANAAGLIEPYVVDAMADYDPIYKPESHLYSGMYTLYLTTTYNTDLVSEADAPKTFEDLLDPRWKGKMVWSDTRGISGPPGFIGNVLQTMGQEKGMEYLRKLATQDIAANPGSQRAAIDTVIAGQYEIGLMTYNHHALISAGKGAPIAWVKMEPLVANLGAISLIKGAPHPNAAKLFLEYFYSKEGAEVIRDANYPPGHPDVPSNNPTIAPTTGNFTFTLLGPDVAAQDQEPLKTWLKIYDELFK